MHQNSISFLCFYDEHAKNNRQQFEETLQSIKDQPNSKSQILILNDSGSDFKADGAEVLKQSAEATLGERINAALDKATGDYVVLADNRNCAITFKRGFTDLAVLACSRHKSPGMVYGDYELHQAGKKDEIRLLKNHIGRVRDNQDFGRVFFMPAKALKAVNGCNADLKFNTLYDLRLRLSQKHELIHVANRYAGSLYSVIAESKKHNVFDYLMAGKDSQLEAEEVLTKHLKAIGGYLAPGAHYGNRPQPPKDAELNASVIIPVNNRPEFIGTAIESVQAQTVKDVEVIIVVNGGEEDPTIKAVKQYMKGGSKYDAGKPAVQLLVYNINNLGLCLNMGAHAARGRYYVQLDSDDRLKPDAVEKILKVYDDDPKIGMVIGSYEVWEKKADGSMVRNESVPVVTHDEWTEENGRNNLLRINGAGAPRSIPIELIRQLGFSVNEEPYARNYGEDYAMVLRLSEQHRIGRVWDAIYDVVRHAGGTDHSIDQATIDRNDEAKDFMRREAIERRIRLNGGKS